MNQAMPKYTEFPLPTPYNKWVEAIWFFENPTPQGSVKRVFPDCCVDLIFDLKGKREPWWIGTMTRPILVQQNRPSKLLGIRFRPGYAAFVLGGALEGAADNLVEAASLGQRSIVVLGERLINSVTQTERLALVEKWLQGIFTVPNRSGSSEILFLNSLKAHGWENSISSWAGELGVSTRTLERVLKRLVGVTPGQYRSLLRFCNALKLLDLRGEAGAETAVVSGYFDQPHFIRDFKRFSGLTPGQYLMSH